jgi:hypothetical protein
MMKKTLTMLTAGLMLLATSCKDDPESPINEVQSAAIEDQSKTEAYFNEAGDLSTTAYNEPSEEDIGGRTSGTITITVDGDTRFNGAVVTLVTAEGSTFFDPKGNITIDFGEGQTDPKGTIRKGKILVEYNGPRFAQNSYTVITFDNYYVKDVKIEGTRTVITSDGLDLTKLPNVSVGFSVSDVGGKAIFSDGTFITREASHTHTIVLALGGTAAETTWTVSGQASGQTRAETDYSFAINRALVFRLDCALNGIALPAEGEAMFTLGAQPISLNYGNVGANCDNVVEVSVSGHTESLTIN